MRYERVSKRHQEYLEQVHASELMGVAEEAHLLAGKYPAKITWQRRRRMGRHGRRVLLSPFGFIEVQCDVGFVVSRNDAPLRHSTCRPGRPSIFRSAAAAMAAAERHLALGWGSYGREPDCLGFDWDDSPRRPRITSAPQPASVDDELIYDWGTLLDRCEPWGYPFWAAWDVQITEHVPHPGAQRGRWQEFAGHPAWHHPVQGWFALQTPYGELVVRRDDNAGWIAERNGRALCYGRGADNLANLKVVFGDYRDAQTLALLWVFPLGRDNILHWSDDPPAMAAA